MPDTDPITLRHLAVASGMSVAGVSKILRGDYKANTPKGKKRVEEVTALAQRMGYIANGSARRLRTGRHHAMAVLVPADPEGHPEFISFEFINGIASALSAANYTLSLLTYPRTDPALAVARLVDRNVDAVLVLEQSSSELEHFLSRASIPALYINVEPKPGLITVCRNEYAAARSVMEITIGLGYRRIIVAGGWSPTGHFSYLHRASGIADTVAANPGIDCIYCGIATWAGGFEDSVIAARPDHKSLVLAIDATTALRLPNCLPPKQPIASCDDSHQFIGLAPWLTRACFDRAAMGRQAGEQMLRHLQDRALPLSSTTVASRVMVGESTPALPSIAHR